MCHDFDAYLMKARIAEQMRTKKPVADNSEKQRGASPAVLPVNRKSTAKTTSPFPCDFGTTVAYRNGSVRNTRTHAGPASDLRGRSATETR